MGRDVGRLGGHIAAGEQRVGSDRGVLLRHRGAQVAAVLSGPLRADGRAGRDRGRERQPRGKRLSGRADGVERAEGITEPGLRAADGGDHRQAAVVVEEIHSQLGAVAEVGQIELEVEPVLARIPRVPVRQPRDILESRDERAAQRAEIHSLVGEGAEAEQHPLPAGHAEVVRAEVRAGGLGPRIVPFEQIQELAADALAQLQIEHRHLIGQQRFLELGSRHAQRRHIEVVDRVETALNERALAPAHDLPAEAQLRAPAAEIEPPEAERIEQPRVVADEILRGARQGRALGIAVHHREIVEAVAAHENARAVPVVERQLCDRLERAAEDALAVVEIAVVDVRRAAAAAVGGGNQPAVPIRDPPALTVAEGGVPAAAHRARLTLEADSLHARGKAPTQARHQRRRGNCVVASRMTFAHVTPCLAVLARRELLLIGAGSLRPGAAGRQAPEGNSRFKRA